MDHETRDMLLDTAGRFFAERCGKDIVNGVEKGVWPAAFWAEIEEMGLPLTAVPEDKNGVGGTLADLMAVLRLAGANAVPVPLAETALANLLIAAAGGKSVVVVVAKANAKVTDKPSHAGEPYGAVAFENAVCEFSGASAVTAERALELAALARAMQMAGAADKVLATTVEYSKQRVQFGRSISTFQAIQHMLAELASCVAATIASAEAATRDADEGGLADGGSFSIAAAKTQASDFAQRICGISHQSMGAMGFTHEHILHHYTRRLWVWRRDFGSESFWGEKIGAAVAKAGPQALWPSLTSSKYAA